MLFTEYFSYPNLENFRGPSSDQDSECDVCSEKKIGDTGDAKVRWAHVQFIDFFWGNF